ATNASTIVSAIPPRVARTVEVSPLRMDDRMVEYAPDTGAVPYSAGAQLVGGHVRLRHVARAEAERRCQLEPLTAVMHGFQLRVERVPQRGVILPEDEPARRDHRLAVVCRRERGGDF